MTISAHDCVDILRKLYLIREVDELIARWYMKWKMRCSVHLSVEQKGVPAALAQLLRGFHHREGHLQLKSPIARRFRLDEINDAISAVPAAASPAVAS